jgi:hypothetical protein
MFLKRITIVAIMSSFAIATAAEDSSAGGTKTSLRPSEIFQFTNVWTIHLSFTPEQWEAMVPKQQGRPQFGGRRASLRANRKGKL